MSPQHHQTSYFSAFSVSPCLRGFIAFSLAFAALNQAAAAPPQEIQELMKIQEKALADAKALSLSSLPDPKTWGEDWRKAWEIPAGFPASVPNEDAYWQKTIKNMGAAGLTQADAQKVLSVFTDGFAKQGMTSRDGLIQALTSLRGNDAPAGQKILDQWETAATTLRLASSAGRDRQAFQKTLMSALGAPYKDLSDAQLTETYLREATLIKKRTLMSFFKCNNFAALAKVQSDQDIKNAGLWIGTVDVNLMFADESRIAELQDLPAAEIPNLQARLQAAVQGCVSGMQPILKQRLDKELEAYKREAEAHPDNLDARRNAEEAQKKYNDTIAAMGQTQAQIAMKQFGDNSYVVRIIGVNPDVAGEKAGLFVGWIRKGHVMCEISVKGNAPEAELSKAMDHFLSEMDAKLASYDSSLAGFMKIAPAGALPTPTNPPAANNGAPNKEKAKPKEKVATGQPGTGANPPPPPPVNPGENPGPASATTSADTAAVVQASDAWNRGDQATSRQLVAKGLAANPNNIGLLMMRGAMHNVDNDLAAALADYKRASEIDPNNLNARRYHALFQLVAGDAKIAAQEADAAIRLSNGDIETQLLRGQAAMAMDKPEEAQSYFRIVLQGNPNRAESLYAEGDAALKSKSFMVANLQFQTVLWLNPGSFKAHFARGVALTGLGKKKQAIAAYERYLQNDPTSDWARQAKDAIKKLKEKS